MKASCSRIAMIAALLASAPLVAQEDRPPPGDPAGEFEIRIEVRPSGISDTTVIVEGRRIHALCAGSGEPGVALLHGAGSRAATWRPVLQRWSLPVRACAYDRAGHGESDPVPGGRDWRGLIEDLGAIHRALGFTRPPVVVGHSLGGLYARALAVVAPGDVAGLVLVDPAHEDLPDRARSAMPRDVWAEMVEGFAPNGDGIDQRALGTFLRGAPELDVPVTVITATRRQDGPGWDPGELDRVTREVHRSIIDEAPDGRHVVAEGAGHNVHVDRPDLVLEEIAGMTRRAAVERGVVAVNGVELFVRAAGSGEPVVVLHGGPSPGSRYLVPLLERLAQGFRVVAYDQRGTGRSSFPADSVMSRDRFVDDLEGLRDALGFDRIHLVGHSWGGHIALAYAARHTERLRSLALVGTTEPGSRYDEELRENLDARRTAADSTALAGLFGSAGFERGDVATLDRVYRVVYRSWFADPSLAERLLFGVDREMAEKGRAAARLFAESSPPIDLWGELAELSVPVLVVHGARDPVPVAMARELAATVPDGVFVRVGRAGHFPWVERPEVVLAALRGFLQTAE